jgi:ATP-dependent helicase/nuclease subunit A
MICESRREPSSLELRHAGAQPHSEAMALPVASTGSNSPGWPAPIHPSAAPATPASSSRAWREVYLVGDGDRFVEGYTDLLAESSNGKLMVVDYRTDRVDSAEDIAAKTATTPRGSRSIRTP